MILYMYIAKGRDRQPLGDKILMSTENHYHFAHLLPVIKKKSLKSDFLPFLCVFFFSDVYSPRQGQTTMWGPKFYDT